MYSLAKNILPNPIFKGEEIFQVFKTWKILRTKIKKPDFFSQVKTKNVGHL